MISAGMKFRNKKTFRYGIPAYSGPFQALRVFPPVFDDKDDNQLSVYVLCLTPNIKKGR
jgi:hypothetical protein